MPKDKHICLRISEEDHAAILAKSKQAGLTQTEYVMRCCLDKQIVVIDGLDAVAKEQNAIGRNLNQLTMLAATGKIKTVYMDRFAEAYDKVGDALLDILERRRWR